MVGGGGTWGVGRERQCIGDHVLRTWKAPKIRSEFGDGREMSLLSGCLADQGFEMRDIAVTSGLWSVCLFRVLGGVFGYYLDVLGDGGCAYSVDDVA